MYTKDCPLRKPSRNSRHKFSRGYLPRKNRAVSTTPQRKRFGLDSHAPVLQSYGLPTPAQAMPMPCPCPCVYMLQCADINNTLPPSRKTMMPHPPSPQTPSSPLRPVKPPHSPINAPPSPPLPPLQKPSRVSPNSSSSPASTPTDKTLSHSSPTSHPRPGAGQSFAGRSDRSACSCRRVVTSAGIRCRRGGLSHRNSQPPFIHVGGGGGGSTAVCHR